MVWGAFGQLPGSGWDLHADHYPGLKDRLLPGFEMSYSALILGLEERSLLDETLVLGL